MTKLKNHPAALLVVSGTAILSVLIYLGLAGPSFRTSAPVTGRSSGPVKHDLSKLPLAFEPNTGVHDPSARFTARTSGGAFSFAASYVSLNLTTRASEQSTGPTSREVGPP